jgi:hypothetical protein
MLTAYAYYTLVVLKPLTTVFHQERVDVNGKAENELVFKQREYKESLKTPNIYKYIYNLKTV